MSASSHSENAVRLQDQVPEEISRRVGEEVLKRDFEPGIWAQALASVSGRRDEALAAYSRLRIAQLVERRKRANERAEAMEFRRLNKCLGVRTVRELLNGMSRVGAVNLPRPKLPFLWLLLMVVGIAGCLAALVRLFGGDLSVMLAERLPFASIGVAIVLVAGFTLVSRFLSTSTLSWLWGDGVMAACGLVCIGSFLMGAKLLIKNPMKPQYVSPRTAVVEGPKVAGGLMAPCYVEASPDELTAGTY